MDTGVMEEQPHLPGLEPNDRELQAIWRALEEIEESKEGLITSDGGSTSYYTLPDHATELRHLISAKGMSKSRGDIFKACYRLGQKKGADVAYDLKKMKFFIDDLIEMHERGEHL